MTSVQYPSANTSTQQAGPNLGWAYDTMGRLNTMTDLAAQTGIIGGATYNPANQLLTMSGLVNETRTYNAMLQLTGLTAPNVNISYYYYNSVQNNNGKITSQVDMVTGEQVNYAYDALNRLASAATSYQANVPQWGQSYTYDGFGNLTNETVIAGSAPSFSAVYDPSTNHPAAGFGSVDANGNLLLYADGGIVAYDGRNRMTGVNSNYQYSYDPSNKRVWRGVWTNGTLTTDEVTFWSVSGQKLATYQMNVTQNVNPPVMYASQTGTNYYFGAKLIKNAGGYVGADRLGSIGHFYPWGQEKPSATQNGTEKFTGYFRDAETGLDYAKNRYHNPGTGRFLTPDPYMATSSGAQDPTNPSSWNRYAYVQGDPVNANDPSGEEMCDPGDSMLPCGGGWGSGGGGGGCDPNDPACGTCDPCDPTCESLLASPCIVDPGPGGGGGAAPPGPDCNTIVAAVGFAGLTYANASEIWTDGSLSTYSTDSTAAIIGALAAVTWQGESRFSLYPTNNGNYSPAGNLLSVDYGPFQINQKYNPNSNSAVWGTNGAGQIFNGNPYANITFGIQILEGLYNHYGNGAAGRYVGSPRTPNGQKRQTTWNNWGTSLTNLFSNTDCFPHQ